LIFSFKETQSARGAIISLCLLTLLAATASCKRSGTVDNQNAGAANVNGASQETSATPPFATKEPERYQAVRVVTSTLNGASADNAQPVESKRTVIARDGDKRREDYETEGGTISFLQLSSGSYLLLPEKKLYAEWKPDAIGATDENASSAVEPVLPADKLLNEARPQSHYEKLGTEKINGRETVKYRVTVRGQMGTAKDIAIESLIWVDETLGMPVKSELISPNGAKVSMELRDIAETVDESVFDLPQDYRKVAAREILEQLNQAKTGVKP